MAIAEMAFAGGVGADLTTVADADRPQSDEVLLFAESTTRFLVEVPPAKAAAFLDAIGYDDVDLPDGRLVDRLRAEQAAEFAMRVPAPAGSGTNSRRQEWTV